MNLVSLNKYNPKSVQLLFAWLLTFCILFLKPAIAHATPAAGTSIGNQASATYTDSSSTQRTVTSNTVVTIVQQVASLTLAANGAKNVSPGGQVTYSHTITNTGNGTDNFNLTSSNSGGFVFGSAVFYADANGDGVADNSTPITTTGDIAAGSTFKFVIVGTVGASVTNGSTNSLVVTATSTVTPSVTTTNTNTSTISSNAVINVTKAIDVTTGASPSGPRTITLTYTNTGNLTASNLTLTDLLPSGMTYVANSGRWSVTGSTVLTDTDKTDNQSGVIYDFGVTQSGRVTAVIASLAAGTSGSLTFQVNINSGLVSGVNAAVANTAQFSYNDGVTTIAATNTNTVQFIISQSASLTMVGATVASATQGSTVSFNNVVTNTGNNTDSFDLTVGTSTFPSGTAFALYQADGVTPLVDSNGNGIPDTGPLAPAATYTVVLKAILPPGATGAAYTVQKTATSKADPTKLITVTDTLTAISSSTVDVTANSSGGSAPGAGNGPEASAVITNTVNPGVTSRFTLYLNNSSSVADTYNLQASTDGTFAGLSLPAGWTVVFKDANGAIIANSGIINAGANKLVYADVSIPAAATPGTTDVYFRAISPTSGASDRLHDAITVNGIRSLTLTPNNSGQIFPGGSVVYSHTITNTGNVLEGDGTVSNATLAMADNTAGFSSVVYWDKNNNGILDSNDIAVTNLNQLTGGSNGASTAAGLSAGESATLFVKVYAAANAAAGVTDTSTLTLSITGTVSGIAAPSSISATDSSNVLAGQVTLVKMQALDANCDGTADTVFGLSNITTGAIPGACIRYQITATNVGISNVTSVVISDATPVNTLYHATVAAATTAGTITAPTNGNAGTVQATVGTLTPGQTAVMTFGVRITP